MYLDFKSLFIRLILDTIVIILRKNNAKVRKRFLNRQSIKLYTKKILVIKNFLFPLSKQKKAPQCLSHGVLGCPFLGILVVSGRIGFI
jgi:hypothetical protein